MPPKIPAHVFGYTLATIPGIMYAIYYKRNHQSDEEFEEMLRKNYGNNIEGSKAKREEMTKFMQGIKNPNSNAETEKRLAEALHGGRGEAKRHYAVDERLYGTEEGARLRQEAEKEQKRQKRKKDKRSIREASGGKAKKDWKEQLEEASSQDSSGNDKGSSSAKTESSKVAGVDTKQVAAITLVGALAAGIGFLLGGKKSQ